MQNIETEIIVRSAGEQLLRRELHPGVYILGRARECDLSFDVELVSRKHAKLTVNPNGKVVLEDLGSSNGTFVGDVPITEPVFISQNQRIGIGAAQVEIRQTVNDTTGHSKGMLEASHRYVIGGQIARGGMGAILAARQPAIRRDVAMKVMLDDGSVEQKRRFIYEAQITGQLEHPNIVPVHELSLSENGQPFYTMKMVQGITLKTVLELLSCKDKDTIAKYTLGALLTIFQKICDAVAFAHSRGILHRDLKPANVMLGDYGEVLVMDWGIAKSILHRKDDCRKEHAAESTSNENEYGDSPMTVIGTVLGTPQFMSPEQARGEVQELDCRSDVYTLGAILFNLTFLVPPYTGRSTAEILAKARQAEVEWPETRSTSLSQPHLPGGNIPESLRAVLHKSMALNRDTRYATVEELQSDLTAFQNGFPTSAENASFKRQMTLAVKRHQSVSWAIAASVLVILALSVGFIVKIIRSERKATANAQTALQNANMVNKTLLKLRQSEKEALRNAAAAHKSEAEAQLNAIRANDTLTRLRETAPVFAAQADSSIAEGNLEEALSNVRNAIVLEPEIATYHLKEGNILEAQLNFKEAIKAYGKAIAADPKNALALHNVALAQNLLQGADAQGHIDTNAKRLLFDSMLREGRVTEAAPLAKEINKSSRELIKVLSAQLKQYKAQAGWKDERLSLNPNGTIAVDLSGLKIGKLDFLNGYPISELDLSSTDVMDLTMASNLPLTDLTISNTKIRDLSPVRALKLEYLDCGYSPISSVEPLQNMPIKTLILKGTDVKNLKWLVTMPLEYLDITNLGVRLESLQRLPLRTLIYRGMGPGADFELLAKCTTLEEIAIPKYGRHIESLKRLPNLKAIGIDPIHYSPIPAKSFWSQLTREMQAPGIVWDVLAARGIEIARENSVKVLDDGTIYVGLGNLPLEDIDFLRGLRISSLRLHNTHVKDLSPLIGAPLKTLNVAGSPVSDLAPLAGLPLVTLNITGTQTRSFQPLLKCPTLESLAVQKNSGDLSVLRQLPKLKRISYEWDGVANTPTMTAEQFWAEYSQSRETPKQNGN